MMFAVFAMERDFKRGEMDSVCFFGVSLGLFDIADDVLPVRIGERVTLEHRLKQPLHRHNMRANGMGVEAGAGTVPTGVRQRQIVSAVVATKARGQAAK